MAAIQLAQESCRAIAREGAALMLAHWREVGAPHGFPPPDPDWAIYQRKEDAGQLIVVTARAAGALVGYISLFVGRHLHYRDLVAAQEDVHYLAPEHRGAGHGRALISAAKDAALHAGAQIMLMRTKASSDHGALLQSIGFRPIDNVYLARLP